MFITIFWISEDLQKLQVRTAMRPLPLRQFKPTGGFGPPFFSLGVIMAIQNFISGGFYGKLGAMVGQRWRNKGHFAAM